MAINSYVNKQDPGVRYKCLRRILGITRRWPERIRKEDLWQQTGYTRAHRNRDKEAILEIDWSYTKERKWKHRQSCTGVESTGETEERTPHTELEENVHVRAEDDKHHVDGMQENGKEQYEVESTSRRPMFHLGMKRTKRERQRERERERLVSSIWKTFHHSGTKCSLGVNFSDGAFLQ